MPYRTLLLLAAGLGAGCGASDGREVPAAAERVDTLAQAQSVLRTPAIHFVSAAGRQRATPGKSCVLTVGQGRGEGAGKCTIPKAPVRARRYSVVRPGERVEIAVPGARIIRRPGCTDPRECGGWAVARRTCGGRKALELAVPRARTRWTADLDPGVYELTISIDFETPDALTGDATAVAGLLVSNDRRVDVLPATRAGARCSSG